jgi:hypothetical protein
MNKVDKFVRIIWMCNGVLALGFLYLAAAASVMTLARSGHLDIVVDNPLAAMWQAK